MTNGNGKPPPGRKPIQREADARAKLSPTGHRIGGTSLEIAERARRAYELHLSGMTNAAVAREIGTSERTAKGYIYAARSLAAGSLGEQTVAEMRAVEVERLDAMMIPFYQKALRGHQGAGYLVLEIMRHRAKILGLEAPTKLDVQHTVAVSPDELNQHIERRIKVIEASTGTDG